MSISTRTLLSAGLVLMFSYSQAMAWSHAGRFGGSASGGGGSWSGETRSGASVSGGDGSWNASNRYGGSASGGNGSWNAESANGGTASGSGRAWTATGENGNTAVGYRNAYPNGGNNYYRPPVTVNNYSSGCYNCGYHDDISPAGAAVAGAAVGAAAANRNAYYTNSYYNNGSNNDYNAGYAAGQASNPPAQGITTTTLPAGCSMNASESGTFYVCGSTWYKPSYGANGVFYTVVPAP